MKYDLASQIGAIERRVENDQHEGQPARVVVASRAYATSPEDVWDAITDPERLPRWFLPIEGDLRLGGRYQLQGNAGGEIDLGGGVHKYLFRGNWKLQLENTVDMYHVPFSHESTVRRSGKQFGRRAGEDSASAISDRGNAAQRWEQRSAWGARSTGHSYNGHQPIAEELPDDPLFRSYRTLLEKRHGVERTKRILTPKRHNTAFYPNMTLQALNQHIRVIVPVSVDRTEVHVYPVMLKGAPEEFYQRSVAYANIVNSPSSNVMPDDIEVYARCQEGLATNGGDWVSLHREAGRDKAEGNGRYTAGGLSELPMRNQYRAWASYMTKEA